MVHNANTGNEKIIYDSIITDEERALYGIKNALVTNCRFAGEGDGESCLKETSGLSVTKCVFDLRYPLWHNTVSVLSDSVMSETCRAPLWYCSDLKINNLKVDGVKAIRECSDIDIKDSYFSSTEFCWLSKNISLKDCEVISQYPFFKVDGFTATGLKLCGKYSFQYCNDVVIENSNLDTKDSFWHSKNVTVKNSYVKGEYLGWYSENLTLINCTVEGTQPFCYAKNLKLVNCKMVGCDLSFEHTTVDADVCSDIISVKNPIGTITAHSIGEIIIDGFSRGQCKIVETHKK